ncbi:eukaryotic translation initiation factor 3 subunit M [Trichonephila inaurata madagascariensis]|uniref:Eukaryotic translation initiation factor 3 subunit M n=1 Tax=Trichonephila inaurata madagascariensis TaxID=2747483 RepID=A0A8X6WPW8_9ARAC|nr:eukaryotic translation initiation factor 3 subunit M [Trichonephila inaurata madagascariensis]
MSAPTFNDATDEEQYFDLRGYLKSLGADISEENSEEGYLADLQDVINASDFCFREANEADAECTLNSIVSLLIMVPQSESEPLVNLFCEKLTRAPSLKMGCVAFKVLQNLFAGIGEHSSIRYDVYFNLVRVAGQTDNVNTVFKDLNKMKSWLTEMKVGTEKTQKLLRLLHEVLVESKQSEMAAKVMIELLGTYTEDNASQARDDAHKCIVTSLGDPNTFLMDHLLVLKPVRFLEGELIHDLLTIFVSEKLSSYLAFYAANKDFVNSLGLSHEQNLQKMRLLTFMQMSETQKEIPFSVIEQELQLKPEEVESFIIDVLRTKLARAKIDELQQRVLVSSTMHRTFGKPQWQQLREILTRWQNDLGQVQSQFHTVLRPSYDTAANVQS